MYGIFQLPFTYLQLHYLLTPDYILPIPRPLKMASRDCFQNREVMIVTTLNLLKPST